MCLSTLFFILAIAAYAWYAQKPDWRRYLLVAALFAAGLMAKPMVITLPFVLMLLDYWPLERTPSRTSGPAATVNGAPRVGWSRLVLEKIPLLLLSAASAWITLIAQQSQCVPSRSSPSPCESRMPSWPMGCTCGRCSGRLRLAAFYPQFRTALPAWQWILSALVLISVTALVVIFRSKRYLPVGWFWFLGTLIPVLGLVQVGEFAMADRYAYMPLIGVFVMIAWGLADLADAEKEVRTAIWRVHSGSVRVDGVRLRHLSPDGLLGERIRPMAHTLEVAESPMTHNALGVALMHPDSELTGHDLENFGTAQNRMDEARRHYRGGWNSPSLVQQRPGRRFAGMAGT